MAPLSFSCSTGNGLDSEGGSDSQTIASSSSSSSSSVASGTGGSGGASLCKQDCSKVNTSDCLKSVCNDGSFQGTIGECVVVSRDDGTSCEDGKFCTVNDTCTDGVCIGGGVNDCGMDPAECSAIACDETSKTCKNVAGQNGDQCTPDDLCAATGTCSGGKCIGEPIDCSFSPYNECNDVACNPTTGVCEPTADDNLNGHTCSLTGDQCNTGKVCLNGSCQGGTPMTCTASGIECQPNVCNSQTGVCEPTSLDEGTPCFGAADQCNTGACDATGVCAPKPVADNTKCNDKNSCTKSDVCTAGVCDGTDVAGCGPLYSEDFETCPDNWTLAGDWQCGKVTVGPKVAESGVNALGVGLVTGHYSNGDVITSDFATSPSIDLTAASHPAIQFYLWVDTEGTKYDGGNLQISGDNGTTFTQLTTSKVYPLTLNSAPNLNSQTVWGGHETTSGWQLVTADLAAYAGKTVKLRFAFGSDSVGGNASGIYVDNFEVIEQNEVPLQITTPNLAGGGVNQPYSSPLDHTGGTTGAKWSIVSGTNDGWLTIDTNTGKLGGTPLAANIGAVSVTVQVSEPTLPSNVDQKTFTFDVGNVFYNQSFDGTCANTGWTFAGEFACGVPTTVGPATTFDGTQCFGTNLTGNYKASDTYAANTATSAVLNLSPTTKPKLNFYAWKDTDPGADGFDVLVSADGINFTVVTAVSPAYGGAVKSQQAWSGHNPEWVPYTVDLGAYAGQTTVKIRFAFASDAANQFPGVYIDDIYITDP